MYFLSNDKTKFFDFKTRSSTDQKYVYVIHIDDINYRRSSTPYPKNFVFSIPEPILKDIKQNLCKLVFDYSFESYDCTHSNPTNVLRFFINNTINQYDLKKDQVILLTGNLYPFKDVPYTICTVHSTPTTIPAASENFVRSQIELIDKKTSRDYKILSLMRNPRFYRIKFAYDIFVNNLRNDNLITCRHSIKDYNKDFFKFYKETFKNQEFINSLPWVYDYNEEDKDVVPSNLFLRTKAEENLYLNSYVNFVIETFVDNTSLKNKDFELDITEKVFKPVSRMQPFVILGQPKALEYLHSIGIKTFDHWWDESYYSNPSSEYRYDAFFSVFKKINAMSKVELAQMLFEMKPILEHNRIVFEEYTKAENYLADFKNTLNKMF